MKQLHIIMPMAGEGTRFSKEGYYLPKPLIDFDGLPLFAKSMSSLDCFTTAKRTFIVRNEHISKYNIDRIIKQYYPKANIIGIDGTTRGSIETAYKALPLIDSNDSLVLIDCDLFFNSNEYYKVIESVINGKSNVSGAIVTFNTDETDDVDPKYSYALCDDNGYVMKTAEKVKISDNAIIGAYFISNSNDFINYFNTLTGNNPKDFYTSLIYNYLISNNHKVVLTKSGIYKSFGTPTELERSKND